MYEEEPKPMLDLLCIGERSAGKSTFLRQYTGDHSHQDLYQVLIKRVGDKFVYFHDLCEEEELYLEKKYDGILFFLDFVSNWKAAENILKWLEMQSRGTGTNIFKIPIKVIVNRVTAHPYANKWKYMLNRELESILDPEQIFYF